MAGALTPWPKPVFLDNNGAPAASYRLFTYLAGTSTKTTTWNDSALSVANSNPTTLDSSGRTAAIFLSSSVSYKFVLGLPGTDDPPGSSLWTQDNISGASGAPTTASYLTLALDSTLSAERVLTAGGGITFTDSGANGTLTIAQTALTAFQLPGGSGGAGLAFSNVGTTRGYGFVLPYRITVGKIVWTLQLTDASATNQYQMGIYDSVGVLVEKTAAFVINGAATGEKTQNLSSTVTMNPGKYYFCTSALTANVAAMAIPANVTNLTFLIQQQVAASVFPASFTPPSDAWVRDTTSTAWFSLVP